MKFYFDTEFIENGKTIDLISIGIVAQDGESYYAINSDCNLKKANDWVKDNVISKLPDKKPVPVANGGSPRLYSESRAWKQKKQIKLEVLQFIKRKCINNPPSAQYDYDTLHKLELDNKPEFWAYYADYDWVVFCQLFGTMMDLPKGFPMYCNDIKQECDRLGNPELPEQIEGEHNALEDARWNKQAFEFLADRYVTSKS